MTAVPTPEAITSGLATLRPAVLGSAGCFGVAVALVACVVDPAVPQPYLIPKEYALLLASAAAVLVWAFRLKGLSWSGLRVSAIEVTLATSILWSFVSNPQWLATHEATRFWMALAALLLTVVVRQLFNAPEDDTVKRNEPTLRMVAVADLMTALWIVGSALALHGLYEAMLAGSFRGAEGGAKTTVVSVIGGPNPFGAFMAAGIIAALTSAAQARSRLLRALLAGAVLIQLAALIGNGSRGALLGLFAAGLLVLWLRSQKGPADQKVASGRVVAGTEGRWMRTAVLGLAVLAVMVFAGLLLHRMNVASGRGRLIAWEISGAMLADKPITGIGTGRFGLEWGRYQEEMWRHPDYAEFDRQALSRTQPNSELFQQLAEQGLPGGAFYVLIWAFALGFLVRALRRSEVTSVLDWGLLALLYAILVHSLVDGSHRWMGTLLTTHLAFGLVPAPVLFRVELRRGWSRQLAMAVAVAWALIVAGKTAWEYPGYRLWAKAGRVGPVERLELLERAGQRVHSEAGLDRDLGHGLLAVGRAEQAAVVLQRGLEKQDGLNIRLALAEAQLELGWLESAEQHTRVVAARYPDRLGPRMLLARIHHARGEEAQARAALASCIRRDTYFRSGSVDSVVAQATQLWRSWYDDDPPG